MLLQRVCARSPETWLFSYQSAASRPDLWYTVVYICYGMQRSIPNPVYTNIYHNILQKSIAVYTKIDRYPESEMELSKAEEIAARLRQKIADGTLQAGIRLASERDLSMEFGVSRMTVRHAIEILESEGLVARYPGRGTFVGGIRERVVMDRGRETRNKLEAASITASELRISGSFLKDMERLGRKPQVQFLEQPALVPSNAEIASHLNLEKGTLVLKRYRLQLADNLPYRLIESFYPSDLFGELLTLDIGDTPLFAWLQERHGLKVTHTQEML